MALSVAGVPERRGRQTRPAINKPGTAITRRTQIVAPTEAAKFTRPMAASAIGAAIANCPRKSRGNYATQNLIYFFNDFSTRCGRRRASTIVVNPVNFR
jgi:hypothetical protein